MTYIPAGESSDGQAKVVYRSKGDGTPQTCDAQDWLAKLAPHVPNRGEHLVLYFGYYSNKTRGLWKKTGLDSLVPALFDSDLLRTVQSYMGQVDPKNL